MKDMHYNLDRILEYIDEGKIERFNNVEIDESYVYDDEAEKLVLVSKDMREVKVSDTTSKEARKEFVQMLLGQHMSESSGTMGSYSTITNTLIKYGFLTND